MRIHPVTCGIGLTFLIELPQGLYCCDCGSPGMQGRVLAQMKALGRADLKLIWITHAHYDHYGSAAALRRLTGAQIGIHPADAESMARGESPLGISRSYGFIFRPMQSLFNCIAPLPQTVPDFTLEDAETLERFGLEASVLHTPGHTPGHTCLIWEDGTALVGDLVGGRQRKQLQHLVAMDWSQLPVSLARLKAANPVWVYSGHSKRPMQGETFQGITSV